MSALDQLRRLCQGYGDLLYLHQPHHVFLRVEDGARLVGLSGELVALGYYLVTLMGVDERELLDNCFKLTYIFSHPSEDILLFVENPLSRAEAVKLPLSNTPAGVVTYASIRQSFPAVEPFERELADMLGLYPHPTETSRPVEPGSWLHRECYPPDLFPLRRDRSSASLLHAIQSYHYEGPRVTKLPPLDGEWWLPIGPIHAGVIEPGRFLFRLAGEVVEEVNIRLGYVHKGIEQLFQTHFTLNDGWQLAEHVAGDASFAHTVAYCQAAEALAGVTPSPGAQALRVLFLELERIANHIGNCAALAHDVAYDVVASDLAALREDLLGLYEQVTGHRLLRGLNRPGGLILPQPLDIETLRLAVQRAVDEFVRRTDDLIRKPAFRERLQGVGILTSQQALCLGATGLAARASGIPRDSRLQHPCGWYEDPGLAAIIHKWAPLADSSIAAREATAGDALARFLVRVTEVKSSGEMVQHVLVRPEARAANLLKTVAFSPTRNFEFGVGIAESWRGDIVYVLMQDKFERIYRCQVRDPSLLNWPALKAAVDRHELDPAYCERFKSRSYAEIIVADFPIVNISFNLSYSANDR